MTKNKPLEEILKCPICGKRFVKESEYIWKPACGCFRKEIRVKISLFGRELGVKAIVALAVMSVAAMALVTEYVTGTVSNGKYICIEKVV